MTRRRARAAAGPFDTYAYWLMPHGLRALMTTILWPAAAGTRSRATKGARRRVNRRRVGPPSPLPARPRPAQAVRDPRPRKDGKGGRTAHVLARVALGTDRRSPGRQQLREVRPVRGHRARAALLGYVPGKRLLRQR